MTIEEAISVVKDIRAEMEDARDTIAVEAVDMVLESLQEPKQGEWIWKKDEDALRTYDLLCSECGYKIFTCENYDNVEQAKKVVDDRIREGKTLFPFCPNCGARMNALKGGEEE